LWQYHARGTGPDGWVEVDEEGDVLGDPGLIVLIGEVRAEGAAAVVRPPRLDALAAAAEDAVPAGGEPGQIAAEGLLVVGRVGELHPGPGEVETDLVGPDRLLVLLILRGLRV